MINKNRNHILYTYNINDFQCVKEYLKSKNIFGFTSTPKEIKPINIILKGLDISYTNDEVKQAIIDLNLKDVTITKDITSLKSKRT